ncbi:HAMP domain-containing histidine kinase [Synechococcus sp. HK05]|uniref:sensor histidine kinase n=1 Tax=Synechococcus sp. HK05 TaxID=2725975 RepID=UPI001C392B61|nr:HAMP domain-containing sensor histidine kinase [Synechococcus sp. HK05]MBV2351379.1 HAMP domain-containing histidine kinase [Synechococcus sp. HK05]
MNLRRKSLYRTLAQWISVAVIASAIGEFLVSQRLSDRIDNLTLQHEATQVLKGFSSELQERWGANTNGVDGGEEVKAELQRLVDSAYTSSHVTPLLIASEGLFLPRGASGDVDLARAKLIIRELKNDDDQYVVNLSTRGPALAAASMPIPLPGLQDGQANLVLLMRWPLLQSLRELQWSALLLKLLTLVVVVGVSSVLLYVLLGPLRRLSAKAKTLRGENLLESRLDPGDSPKEIRELIISYNQAIERLDHEYQQQQLFASVVSHEFKTPLTVISGFIDSVLLRSEALTERDRKKLDIAKNETHRLNRLVSDLLDLSRYDHDRLKLLNVAFSPAVAMRDVFSVLVNAEPGRIRMDAEAEAEHWRALGDPGRYSQVIANLAENALKYSPPSAPVTLRLKKVGSTLVSEVEDRGPGITPADQPKIFDRFYRAEAHRGLTQKPSSGLGLSIVKAMVDSMGGRVGVASKPGHGSKFWVELDMIAENSSCHD